MKQINLGFKETTTTKKSALSFEDIWTEFDFFKGVFTGPGFHQTTQGYDQTKGAVR